MNCQKEYHNSSILPTGLEELDKIYELSSFNHNHKKGAKIIRYFNGETDFGTQEMVDIFTEKTRYVDVFIFDNDQLKEFVLSNIPNAHSKKNLLGWIETPLKRFVHHNQGKIKRSIISLGRFLCSYPRDRLNLPHIQFFPVSKIRWIDKLRGRKSAYSLAGGLSSLSKLYRERCSFYKWEAKNAFGLSHMYDIFSNSINDYKKHKDFYFSLFGQTMPHNVCSTHETYYQFCNNVNKDICYMMNGIIPLISHTEHNVYKEMADKKMVILIKNPEDISAVLKMSDKEIQEYRDNIYANRDLYTFDHVGEMIINQLDEA